MFVFNLCDCSSPEFWFQNASFTAFVSGLTLVFVLPVYTVYFAVTLKILRRAKVSIVAKRRWLLGLPAAALIGAILYSFNQARPAVAIRWVLQGKTFKSLHAAHASHLTTMMSGRSLAWFEIAPVELRGLIAQHQLTPTNGVSFSALLSNDRLLGLTGIADHVPSFHDSLCYARVGSDDFRHPFSLFVFTNPNHDAAVWYATADR